MADEAQAQLTPIPSELLQQMVITWFETGQEILHELGDPPEIVRKFNMLMLAMSGR